MNRLPSVYRSGRSRLRACAAAFVAVAQFAVSSFAPTVDGRAGAGAPTHVESFGVHLHFAHNPDDCAACSAQTLVGLASSTEPQFAGAGRPTAEFALAPLPAPARGSWRADAPRAPPAPPSRAL